MKKYIGEDEYNEIETYFSEGDNMQDVIKWVIEIEEGVYIFEEFEGEYLLEDSIDFATKYSYETEANYIRSKLQHKFPFNNIRILAIKTEDFFSGKY